MARPGGSRGSIRFFVFAAVTAVSLFAANPLRASGPGDLADVEEALEAIPRPGGPDEIARVMDRLTHPAPIPKHAHLMHLDGFRGDLFKVLVESGQLPHFRFLLERGKANYKVSTVDKSETMKVILSYLSSKVDSEVVGWWQFSRKSFQFRNFWLDPVEVVNYALGLDFPVYPTIFDVLAADGKNVTAGFSLHRRSVPFDNYSRAYVEGATSVFKHTYFDQAHATMSGVLDLYEKSVKKGEAFPTFSNSLLAATDEFTHLLGVVDWQFGGKDEFCAVRKAEDRQDENDKRLERVFRILEQDIAGPRRLERLYRAGVRPDRASRGDATAYFTRLVRDGQGKVSRFCFRVPKLFVASDPITGGDTTLGRPVPQRAHPFPVLGMMLIDMEVGRLINRLRTIRIDRLRRTPYLVSAPTLGIDQYRPGREEAIFENTLFVFTGDHGMNDTRNHMAPENEEHPDAGRMRGRSDYMPYGLVRDLAQKLALTAPEPSRGGGLQGEPVADGAELAVDDSHLPVELVFPHRHDFWQSTPIRAKVAEATVWSRRLIADLKQELKNAAYDEYWYLLFLKGLIVGNKIDSLFEDNAEKVELAEAMLARLYLKGDSAYVSAESDMFRRYYDEKVRLVYGGGARNNAEIFLPGQVTSRFGGTSPSWSLRPSLAEILTTKVGADSEKTLIEAIKENPGTGLIFIREENESLVTGARLPDRMHIRVMDPHDNHGLITAWVDPATREPVYQYEVSAGSPRDPLGYLEPGDSPVIGTYNEWNDRSIRRGDYYHNAVAGIGSYLYSNNPAIGDVLMTHAQGWNFGENNGGHGGIHAEEKLTMMVVSGPGIAPGRLMARARYQTDPATGELAAATGQTNPTVLDIAPTVLNWLDPARYGDRALTRFAQSGAFQRHLEGWVSSQRQEILTNVFPLLQDTIRQAGIDLEIDFSRFRDRFARLLRFMPDRIPALPDFSTTHEDGNQLVLDNRPGDQGIPR